MLDLRELNTFRHVATERSFTRAAQLLHYAQSSVTAQIRSLEEEVGAPDLYQDSDAESAMDDDDEEFIPPPGRQLDTGTRAPARKKRKRS